MRSYKPDKSRQGVSGLVGILLILIILFALVIALWNFIPKLEPQKIPSILFSSVYYPKAGLLNLIVTSVTDPRWEDLKIVVYVNGTPLKGLNFTLYPGGISPPKGEIRAGQVLVAHVPERPSKVEAVYLKSNSVIYTTSQIFVGSPMIAPTPTPSYHFELIGSVVTLLTYTAQIGPNVGCFYIWVEFKDVKQLIPENDIKVSLKITNPSSIPLSSIIAKVNLYYVSGQYYFGNGSGIFVLGYYSLPSTYVYLNLTYVPQNYQFFSKEYYFKI